VPQLPWWPERALLLIACLWFVNLTNFMDGIDWMTVAEIVPVAAGIALLGLIGALPPFTTLVALALAGALIGFAPFNRPVAKLFLGDVGSLPLGLLLFWLLMRLAANGHLAAALLLPLYYLADATVTLARRLLRGENILRAHRTHFYQRATDLGFSVNEVVGRVFVVNLLLAGLALSSIWATSTIVDVGLLMIGGAIVAALLVHFSLPRSGVRPRQ
jgi:UDP-N-acetylmuramyl pentapeptide phosphotransferase/UDP-N-acetylglucosamine-1-phosphate transferase